ncbi:hypothetical protein PSTG_00919 [Puccinia striiformis f. sp. tritici PST-78]|uniref:Methyltransferase type 11 domain-containing protein n=1 Tax=Puccinia striiformis f. sp. tritici PST-78 TaxID=1165861 RepID=A0A0L0W340_9BASI|nr:hypothetical protein PSTG_00919 [Puccinia striiformis f. sp. tritici PST-78]
MRNPIKPRQIQQLAKHSRSFSLISRRPNELQASLIGGGGTSGAANPFKVFDRSSKLKQKSRAVRKDLEKNRITHYLRDEVAYGLVDRLRDIRRKYDQIVEFGSGHGSLVKPLLDFYLPRKIILTDSCRDLLWRDQEFDPSDVEISRVVMDEELVSLEPESQECIMSCLSLHWVNDLPGTLIQIQNSLKPDGVFIGAMFGGDTLFELRTSLQLAEQEREGGISARISPMTDSQSMSSLINRAGFSIPTIDTDEITVQYPSIFELMDDLRSMGESNAVINRRTFLKRDTLLAAASIYESMYGTKNEETGETVIPATFQIIYSIGWRPDSSQPKPLKRGSAKQNLKDVLSNQAQ